MGRRRHLHALRAADCQSGSPGPDQGARRAHVVGHGTVALLLVLPRQRGMGGAAGRLHRRLLRRPPRYHIAVR
eukprot:3858439-Pleurochrysis_carterae.AAC.1